MFHIICEISRSLHESRVIILMEKCTKWFINTATERTRSTRPPKNEELNRNVYVQHDRTICTKKKKRNSNGKQREQISGWFLFFEKFIFCERNFWNGLRVGWIRVVIAEWTTLMHFQCYAMLTYAMSANRFFLNIFTCLCISTFRP